jgi:hypothetical protein
MIQLFRNFIGYKIRVLFQSASIELLHRLGESRSSCLYSNIVYKKSLQNQRLALYGVMSLSVACYFLWGYITQTWLNLKSITEEVENFILYPITESELEKAKITLSLIWLKLSRPILVKQNFWPFQNLFQ